MALLMIDDRNNIRDTIIEYLGRGTVQYHVRRALYWDTEICDGRWEANPKKLPTKEQKDFSTRYGSS